MTFWGRGIFYVLFEEGGGKVDQHICQQKRITMLYGNYNYHKLLWTLTNNQTAWRQR